MTPIVPKPISPPRRADPRGWLGLGFWRHGLWLPLALAMLLAAGLLVREAVALRASLRPVEGAALATPSPASPSTSPAAAEEPHISAWRQVLVPSKESTQLVRRLVELTQPELAWQRAQFQQTEDLALGVVQLQITVPVSGEYRQMRKSLDRALLEMPNLSLDQVMFRRQQASDSQLESRLRFSLWLDASRGPANAPEPKP